MCGNVAGQCLTVHPRLKWWAIFLINLMIMCNMHVINLEFQIKTNMSQQYLQVAVEMYFSPVEFILPPFWLSLSKPANQPLAHVTRMLCTLLGFPKNKIIIYDQSFFRGVKRIWNYGSTIVYMLVFAKLLSLYSVKSKINS